jgi:hypothetical protein
MQVYGAFFLTGTDRPNRQTRSGGVGPASDLAPSFPEWGKHQKAEEQQVGR